MLNLTYEILIHLEDAVTMTEVELTQLAPKRKVYGALGQLEKKGWVKKSVDLHPKKYSLTPAGRQFIDATLAQARKTPKNSLWTFVMFDIPEKRRGLRAQLRTLLTQLGFGTLQPSVWISTTAHTTKIEQFALKNNLSQRIHIFAVSKWDAKPSIIARVWDIKKLATRYDRFNRAAQALLLKDKSGNARMLAKELIFDFALISGSSPNLDESLLPKDWPAQKALSLYEELRPLARGN